MNSDKPNMLKAALWYASLGWYVFPVHNPIIKNGVTVGCTCERYRWSDECKAEHPRLYLADDENCANPGKCPRVRWAEKSTIDPQQIKKWWGFWTNANIGIDCGKSGLLVFDADTYKQVGDLADLLSYADRETPTVITGGGGEHLIYDRQGKPYGNSTKNLPPGIDIRGVGGYIVAAPSLHKSGRRYQYEHGYAPHEIPLAPMPAALDDILSAGTILHRGSAVTPGEPDSEAVKRSVWMVDEFLTQAKLEHFGQQAYGQGGRRWVFQHCPFAPDDNQHADDGGAYLAVLDDGRIVAGCHHNRCRQQYEPYSLTGWEWLKQRTGVRVHRPLLCEVTL